MKNREQQRHLGHRIRVLAKAREVDIKQLAAEMGLSEQQMHSRLSGKTALSVDELAWIAVRLECDIATLWSDGELVIHLSKWIRDLAGQELAVA